MSSATTSVRSSVLECHGALTQPALAVDHRSPVDGAAFENLVQGSATHAAIAKAYHALGMVPPQSRLGFLGG
jgi:hypothetical protein